MNHRVFDAAGAALDATMVDRVIAELASGSAVTIRSHPAQMRMYEAAGYTLADWSNRRVTANGTQWQMDGGLPPDELIVQTEHASGIIKNLALG